MNISTQKLKLSRDFALLFLVCGYCGFSALIVGAINIVISDVPFVPVINFITWFIPGGYLVFGLVMVSISFWRNGWWKAGMLFIGVAATTFFLFLIGSEFGGQTFSTLRAGLYAFLLFCIFSKHSDLQLTWKGMKRVRKKRPGY